MRWTALLLCLVMTVTSCGGPTDPTVSQSTITAAEMATRYVRLRDAGYPVWSSIDDILQFLRQKGDSVADVDCWHGSVRDEQQHWADFDAVGAERLTEVIAACPEINPELLAEAIEAANPTASQDELATVIRTMLQIAAVD